MFTQDKIYWYKDSLMEYSEEEHRCCDDFFQKYFPDVSKTSDRAFYAISAGCAKLRLDGDTLLCTYDVCFKKKTDFYNMIVENLTPVIKRISIEILDSKHEGRENYKWMTLSIYEFLNKGHLDDNVINDNTLGIGDLIKLSSSFMTTVSLGIYLKKDDIGLIIGKSPYKDNEYSVYIKDKGKIDYIPFDNLELVKKFEWPEQQ